MNPSIRLVTDVIPSTTEVIALYCAVGWGKQENYDLTQWRQTLSNTSVIFSAYEDDHLVGLLRALTDGAHETKLSDIVVHPDYQRQGIGQKLMAEFVRQQGHTGIYVDGFNQNRAFFEACGFQIKEQMFVASRAANQAA